MVGENKKKFFIFHFSFFILIITGCTYLNPGIYHRVFEGETLWAISKIYGVNVNDIVKANKKLGEPDRIRKGERIFIPGARYVKSVPRSSLNFIWPVRGKIIHKFGKKDHKRYQGIGIKAVEGTPVIASESGRVVYVSNNFRSYGKVIIIEHSKEYTTVYAHNSSNFVNEKQLVKKGETIARVGKTGRAKVPYLYFEVRYMEKPRNPLFILQ